ncbi:MAG: hypothetical protein K2G87_05380, partial [Oscillospiraceae bacterium]|nr:hypothetical protein [Oscillospiraceae bacterium]
SEQHSDFCPICGNKFDINGTMAKRSACGWTDLVKSLRKKETHSMDADSEIAMYRFMSSADAFFARKSYEEAYVGYGSVLDMDGSNLKAVFRRELTSQYLMMESSSVYLSSDGFFAKIKDIKANLIKLGDEKLSLTASKDMLEYLSCRADYEKKYASVHKNQKTAASYLADTLLLYEYTAETVVYLRDKEGIKNERTRAHLIMYGCGLCMKIRGMLLSGAEYVESSKMDDQSKEPSAKNVSRIKRMKLDQKDELQVETLAGNMRQIKKELLAEASPELYAELTAENEKTEKTAERDTAKEDQKRMEYEMWRKRNETEYIAADKRIIIFGIAEKAALVMAVIMALVFVAELIISNVFMGQLIAATVLFAAVNVTLRILKRAAIKKKGFYAEVIDGDSANLRSSGGNFTDL